MKRILLLAMAVGLLLLASSAFGQEVTMVFNGYDGQSWDGGGTGFYYGSVNGTAVGLPPATSPGYLCDDFNDEISIPESWKANGFQVSSLLTNWVNGQSNGTLFGSLGSVGLTGYTEMAILVEAAFSGTLGGLDHNLGANVDELSEVLWCITGGPGSACNSQTMDSKAYALWTWIQANHNVSSFSQFANLWLYVPINGTQSQGGQPQEMWGDIAASEGGTALAYLLLAGLSCIGAMVLRSRNKVPNRSIA